MKKFFIITSIILFANLIISFSVSNLYSETKHRIAILPFNVQPTHPQYYSLSRSVPEMLMTDLGKSQNIQLVERLQIDKALHNFRIEESNMIDQSTAIKIGQWLGCTAVIIGNIIQMRDKIRIDARIVDIRTGSLLDTAKVEGKVDRIFEITDNLATRVMYSFTQEKAFFRDQYRGKILLNKEYVISAGNQISYNYENSIAPFLNFRIWTTSDNIGNSYIKRISFNFNDNLDFIPNINPSDITRDAEYRVSDDYLLCLVRITDFEEKRIEYERGGAIYLENVFKWLKVRVRVESAKE